MPKGLTTRAGGLAWTLWNVLVEALAIPIGLLLAPIFSVARAVDHCETWNRVSAFARETQVMRQQYRLGGRQANDYLREHLDALDQLEETFLEGPYRTAEDARRGYELLERARELLMERARRASPVRARVARRSPQSGGEASAA